MYRVLQPIIEKQKQTQSVRSRGWSGARLSVNTRYGKDLSLKYSNRVWQCDHSCADVLLVDSQLLGLPEGVRMKHEPNRLCGACYAEVPCRKIQLKKMQRREKHELTLLPECPKCRARFQIPGLWVDGWCLLCFMGFREIAN